MNAEITSLKDLYVDSLRDMYSAENQITKALPKIIKKVDSPELRKGLEDHLKQTEMQIQRLDQVFAGLKESPRGKKCAAMEGLLTEGDEVMKEKMAPDIMDAALIGACQKVEHYEIASYGTARAFAELIGEDEAVKLISQSLEEEKAADVKLTQVAMNIVNLEATEAQGQDNGSKRGRK